MLNDIEDMEMNITALLCIELCFIVHSFEYFLL